MRPQKEGKKVEGGYVGSKLEVQYVLMVEETRRAGICGAKMADMTWVGRE